MINKKELLFYVSVIHSFRQGKEARNAAQSYIAKNQTCFANLSFKTSMLQLAKNRNRPSKNSWGRRSRECVRTIHTESRRTEGRAEGKGVKDKENKM